MFKTFYLFALLFLCVAVAEAQPKKAPKPTPEQARLETLKQEVATGVEKRAQLGQQINDMLFSFS